MHELPQTEEPVCHRHRDAMSMKILGSFFIVLSLLVLLGVLWELGNFRAIVVTLICGSTLLSVGVGMVVVGRRIAKGAKPE